MSMQDDRTYTTEEELARWESFVAQVTPMAGRLLVTKPVCQEIAESRTIIIPESARRVSKEFGLECRVLKKGRGVSSDITVDDIVLIPEFAGVPLVIGTDVPFWLVGEGDILAIRKES